MGILDQVRQEIGPVAGPPSGVQGFLNPDEKQALVDRGVPFILAGLRPRMNLRFADSDGKPKKEWNLDLLFCEPDGSLILQPDGEGGTQPVGRTLTLASTPYREQEFGALQNALSQNPNGIGPLYLVKQRVQGQPNAAWMLSETPQEKGEVNLPGVVPAAVPPSEVPSGQAAETAAASPMPILSPDGKFMLIGNQWVQVPQQPAEETPTIPVGQLLPFSEAAGGSGTAPAQPFVSTVQPIPETEVLVGPDGEGGQVMTTRTKPGQRVREARYLGEGVVEQPSGVKTQNVIEDTARAPETAAAPTLEGPTGVVQGPPHLAQQQAPAPVPAPVLAGTPGPEGTRRGNKNTVPYQMPCPSCGLTVQGTAFRDSKARWIFTHTCDAKDEQGKRIGARKFDVHEQIEAILKGQS